MANGDPQKRFDPCDAHLLLTYVVIYIHIYIYYSGSVFTFLDYTFFIKIIGGDNFIPKTCNGWIYNHISKE